MVQRATRPRWKEFLCAFLCGPELRFAYSVFRSSTRPRPTTSPESVPRSQACHTALSATWDALTADDGFAESEAGLVATAAVPASANRDGVRTAESRASGLPCSPLFERRLDSLLTKTRNRGDCAFLVSREERDAAGSLVELLQAAKHRCGFVFFAAKMLDANPIALPAVEKVIAVAKREAKEEGGRFI